MEGVEHEVGVELGPDRLGLGLGPEHGLPRGHGPALVDPAEGLGPHEEARQDHVQEEPTEPPDEKAREGAPPRVILPPRRAEKRRGHGRGGHGEEQADADVDENGRHQAALRAQEIPATERHEHGEARGREGVRKRHAGGLCRGQALLAEGGGEVQPQVRYPGRGEDPPEAPITEGGSGGWSVGVRGGHPSLVVVESPGRVRRPGPWRQLRAQPAPRASPAPGTARLTHRATPPPDPSWRPGAPAPGWRRA